METSTGEVRVMAGAGGASARAGGDSAGQMGIWHAFAGLAAGYDGAGAGPRRTSRWLTCGRWHAAGTELVTIWLL